MNREEHGAEPLFLLGVLQRSGTNFIYRALLNHTEIVESSHPGEDFLLKSSGMITEYVSTISKNWSLNWEGMNIEAQSNKLLNYLSRAQVDYLKPINSTETAKYFFAKTPSTVGLANFNNIFPKRKLLIVVRDGKFIIESGIKSFKWTHIHAMKDFARSLERIKAYIDKNEDNCYCLIRYEDFCNNTVSEVKRILDYLDLDHSGFNFSALSNIPIYGSSSTMNTETGEFEWKVNNTSPKKQKSDKIKWHPLLLRRYNNLSKIADYFGYDNSGYTKDTSFSALLLYLRAELRELKRTILYNNS